MVIKIARKHSKNRAKNTNGKWKEKEPAEKIDEDKKNNVHIV